jgi:hypothetical protein
MFRMTELQCPACEMRVTSMSDFVEVQCLRCDAILQTVAAVKESNRIATEAMQFRPKPPPGLICSARLGAVEKGY